jgi:DNA ligase-1
MDYSVLVEVYEGLEATTKRLEKTRIIADFLKTVDASDLDCLVLLLQGRVFPTYDERKIGVAARLVVKSLHLATGIRASDIEGRWKELGDLGEVAKSLTGRKKQQTLAQQRLTARKVFGNLTKLATLEGKGTVDQKLRLIAELLTSAEPAEAKYIIRTLLEDLRVGVADGVLRDSIVWAYFGGKATVSEEGVIQDREKYNQYLTPVQHAYDVSNDFALVARTAVSKGVKGLEAIGLQVGIPIKVMLALKVDDIRHGFERCGKPAAVEYKYDGFRMQIHKDRDIIRIFTRRLEDVTKQFPEVVDCVRHCVKGGSYILDSEAVGFNPKTKKYMPFQHISQRIRRKYSIKEMAKELPVELNVFDVVSYEGDNLIGRPFMERRKLLEKITTEKPLKIVLSKSIITSDEKEVKEFFDKALQSGNEGVMFKKLDAPYKPGARVGHMVKLKPVTDSLDLVIVAAEWGEGKRSAWITSYYLACRDDDGNLLQIGKVSTGLKEKPEEGLSFKEVSDELQPLITSEKGRFVTVKPQIVVAVGYEEIQKSPTYSSGYALRFPRFKAIRYERSTEDITTLEEIRELYKGQKK